MGLGMSQGSRRAIAPLGVQRAEGPAKFQGRAPGLCFNETASASGPPSWEGPRPDTTPSPPCSSTVRQIPTLWGRPGPRECSRTGGSKTGIHQMAEDTAFGSHQPHRGLETKPARRHCPEELGIGEARASALGQGGGWCRSPTSDPKAGMEPQGPPGSACQELRLEGPSQLRARAPGH